MSGLNSMHLFSWFTEKLVRRLAGPALVLGVLAVFLVSMTVYYTVRSLLEKSVADQLHVAVDLQEKELNRWIEDQKTTTVFISRAPFVRERVADLLSRDEDHPYYKVAYRELSEYLFSYIKNFPGLREIMILSNRGGHVVFSTTTENEDEFRARDSFFLQGKKGFYIQGVYPWRATTEPTITMARPLLGALGQKEGVLAVHLNLERMDAVISDHSGLGQSGEIYLVDKFNTFINAERFGREEFPRGVHTEGIDRAVAGEEGLRYYLNYEGIPVVGYYRWLPDLEVAILAEIQQSEAFYPAQRLGVIIAAIGLSLTFCLIVGVILFARRISRPLEEMSTMAQKIADGDFSFQVPVSGNDETSALADALNKMMDQLQTVYSELGSTAEYFKLIFNLSPSAITVQSYDNGRFVHVNESFCRMFGVSAVQVLGRDEKDLHIWQSEIRRLRFVSLLRQQGKAENFEASFVRNSGEGFAGVVFSRVMELDGEKHILSILVDLSELRIIEEELLATTERLQLIIQRMPVACIAWDTDFKVELWNPQAENVFGYTAQEAVGQHAYDLIVPVEMQPLVTPIWQSLLAGNDTAHSENENVTSDGRTIICEWYNTPLKNDMGEATGVISMVTDITDKKAASDNLQYQKELLQIILNAIPAPIFFKDINGIYRGCNQSFCEYLGLPYEKIVDQSVYDIAPADKAKIYEHADQKLLQQGGIQIYESKVRFADSSDRDVVFHKAVYRNPDGSVGGLVGNMLDVTEIRQAEEELAESEMNYRGIFNASSEAIVIRDMETKKLLDVNQAMLDMYGYDYDEALALTMQDLASGVYPYTKVQATKYMEQAEAGNPQLFEWHARKKDGTLFWTEIALKQTIVGDKSRLLSVVRDISDRKLAEKAQRDSDERFQLLLEHAADALFLHDNEGVILTVNQRSCDNLGYSREELLGMTVNELEEGVPIGKLKEFWAGLEAGKSSLIEGSHLRKDGSSYPVDVNVVKFEFHGAWFYLALARDVSERKATEKELERYRNQLEELVKERTRQLEDAQEELVQKEKMAVLGQLTATVSHELRNPLGTVRNAIHLLGRLKDIAAPEKYAKALALANRNVSRCDGIINELLDYTRQQEWTPVQIDIADWLAALLDEQECPDNIKVTRSWKKGVQIPCEPERLRRAVINVYTNGIQALQEVDTRKRLLKIKIEETAEKLQISFADNGPGIDDETLERIFEPMFSTKNFGVGLGMPIVKNIMEEHGGGVIIESTLGKGSIITLWMPRR